MWMPELGLRGIFKMSFFPHLTVVHGVGFGGGSLVYANTLPVPKDHFFSTRHVGHARRLEDGARRALPDGAAHARRDAEPEHHLRRRGHPRGRQGHRPPGRLPPDRCRRVLRRARQDRARSVLRRRGARARRLHRLRRLHDRLPLQREEHPRQELPLPRREARPRGRDRDRGHRSAAVRRRLPRRGARWAASSRRRTSSSRAACSARSSCSCA